MAGRMGAVRQTTQNLTVHAVDAERGLLLIKGAVPGPRGSRRPRQDRREGGLTPWRTPDDRRARRRGPDAAGHRPCCPSEVFDVQTNVPLIHQVVVAQLAAARQGTHDTKTRGEVRGGGKKPYKQKGTGRARQGSIRAPQFTGGGVAHGPTPRDYTQRTPKKMKAAALRGALSDRARHGRVHVVTGLVDRRRPGHQGRRGRAGAGVAAAPPARRHRARRRGHLEERPEPGAGACLVPDQLNTYDVLCADDVVFTRDALEAFVAGPARGGARRRPADPARARSRSARRSAQ